MKSLLLAAPVLMLLLSVSPARGGPIYFLVAEPPEIRTHGDSFALPLIHPQDIAHARRLIAEGPAAGATIAVARIAAGADGINRDYLAPGAPPWSWRVTEFLGFADLTAEILDGWPGFVESDVDGWIRNTDSTIGFWNYTVVAELGPSPAPLAVPEPTSCAMMSVVTLVLLGCQAWTRRHSAPNVRELR